jgi:hypothetical protein
MKEITTRDHRKGGDKMWQAWINAIIGLWFIVAAFILAGSRAANITTTLSQVLSW